jgi:hypothetical protein
MFRLLCSLSAALCLWVSPAAYAQGLTLAAPAVSRIFDPATHSIRPLLGLPGASSFGPAVVANVDRASISPDGNQALTVGENGVSWLRWSVDHFEAAELAEPLPAPAVAAWSSDSSTLVGYDAAAKTLYRVRADLVPETLADLSTIDGVLTALLSEKSGAAILFAMSGPASGVYRLSAGGSPELLVSIADPAALTVDRAGTLFTADHAGRIWELPHAFSNAAAALPWEDSADPFEPAALAVSESQDALYVFGKTARLMRVYSRSSRVEQAELPLDAQPAGIQPLPLPTRYLLTTSGQPGDPLLLLDTESPSKPVSFIPAASEEN